MLLSKTPVRIAFGGGGTDVEPYSSDYDGFVVNATINYFFRSVINQREDKSIVIYSNDKFSAYKFEEVDGLKPKEAQSDIIKAVIYLSKPEIGMDIYLHGEPPKKAGLGASASLCTCLIGGISELEKTTYSKSQIAEKAYDVEDKILLNKGGRQDQYAAVYGGFNCLEFKGNSDVLIKKMNLSHSFIKELEKRIILYYTGEPHTSGNMVKAQINSYISNKLKIKPFLDQLKNIAYHMKDAIKSEEIETLAHLLTEDLEVKSRLNPLLITEFMEKLNSLVINNGGVGGRVCGAGGGGCMFWIVDSKKKNVITSLLDKQPGKLLDFNFVMNGLQITSI